VLLGAGQPVALTGRAKAALTQARESSSELVHPDGTVVARGGRDTSVRWWTWAGYRANATLTATLTTIADPLLHPTSRGRDARGMEEGHSEAADQLCLPDGRACAERPQVQRRTADPARAEATLAARLADLDGATAALRGPTRFTVLGQ
jgi:ATP-dependent Lhr-like helicase